MRTISKITVTTTVPTTRKSVTVINFTDEEKERFVNGWRDAGGYMGDLDSPTPWCAPWTYYEHFMHFDSETPEEWGAEWWAEWRGQIAEELCLNFDEEQ